MSLAFVKARQPPLVKGIAPAARQCNTGQIRHRSSQRIHVEHQHNVLDAVLGRDREDGAAARQVGELLHILRVLCGWEALLGACLTIIVIQIHAVDYPAFRRILLGLDCIFRESLRVAKPLFPQRHSVVERLLALA